MRLFFILYGISLLSGGYFGWKAKSKISLFMGVFSGLFTFLAVYLIGFYPSCGYWCLMVISGLLSVVFLIRLAKTRKFIPAGLLLGISCVIFLLSIYQFSKL